MALNYIASGSNPAVRSMNKFFKKTEEILKSDKTHKFVKETIKETATDSIATAGRYVLMIIIAIVIGIAGLSILAAYLI